MKERDYSRGNFGYLKNIPHKPMAQMHWYLVWSKLGTRRFKSVQIKVLGS